MLLKRTEGHQADLHLPAVNGKQSGISEMAFVDHFTANCECVFCLLHPLSLSLI